MKTVSVRNVTIGTDRPKICVPLVGRNKVELIEALQSLKELPFDMVEWRADFFELVDQSDQVNQIIDLLRNHLGDHPILFTFRSKKEGGEREFTEEAYFSLLEDVIDHPEIALVDIELFMPELQIKETITHAHNSDVKVVLCNHDFLETPTKEEIIQRLCKMQSYDADICKIAVMPQSAKDVLTVLEATYEMSVRYKDRPVVTMSMGNLGTISRLTGELFGSDMTFGAASKASAPGQIPVSELYELLSTLKIDSLT